MTDQISFNENLFNACPTGMLAMDQNTCIRWLNPALEMMLNISGNELIGKDKNSLPEELQALFDETDVLHLSLNGDGERWLQRDVREVTDNTESPLRLHFYQDISRQIKARQERDQLRQRVEELTITDDLTGLANRRATLQALEVQVTRSRRYGNPLTLGAVGISNPFDSSSPLPNISVLTFTQYLRDRLRWADSIGRYEDQLFLLVMPETKQEDAIHLLELIQQECLEGALKGLDSNPTPLIKVSATAWEKGYDPQRLIQYTLQNFNTSVPRR